MGGQWPSMFVLVESQVAIVVGVDLFLDKGAVWLLL